MTMTAVPFGLTGVTLDHGLIPVSSSQGMWSANGPKWDRLRTRNDRIFERR
jgi:hypothetical protein